ncbi:MAG: zinc ribbon domain-containing protein [Desulfovibrio sp.]|nr:zinc ribbon domain-containing protein [Desulfovibrio sp.]
MPMYEFSCQGCGAVFEELCARDAETCACPACGGQGTRMMSAATPKLRAGSPFTSTPRNAGAGAATGCGCASAAATPASGCACASGTAPKPGGCGGGNGGGCGCSS